MPLVRCDIYISKVWKDTHPYDSLQSTQVPHFGSAHVPNQMMFTMENKFPLIFEVYISFLVKM